MDISNRALAFLLLATMVVSLGGTIVSLNRLGSLSTTGFTPAYGTVDININESLSITTEDSNLINFRTCTPFPGAATVVNSEVGENTTDICPDYGPNRVGEGGDNLSGHGYLAVRNNGNIDVNVTIKSDVVGAAQGGTFLNSSSGSSTLEFRMVQGGHDAYGNGCDAVPSGRGTYAPFADDTTEYLMCANLTTGATNNSFLTHIQITVPYDATGAAAANLTFVAESLD